MKILLTEEEIRQGVEQLACRINDDFGDRPLTIVGVLTGSVVLLADLIRKLKMPLRVEVVQASSYRGTTDRGPLVVNEEMMPDIAGREVLLIDDIYDTGHTLVEIIGRLGAMKPKSICSAVLLYKEGRRQVEVEPHYVAFRIPNEFVVGYGLDYRDEYRNLPHIAALEPDEIEEG